MSFFFLKTSLELTLFTLRDWIRRDVESPLLHNFTPTLAWDFEALSLQPPSTALCSFSAESLLIWLPGLVQMSRTKLAAHFRADPSLFARP